MIDRKEYKKEYDKLYYIKNYVKIKEKQKKYREKNKNKKKITDKRYREENKEKIKEYMKKWHKSNQKTVNQNAVNRRKIDLKFNLNHNITTAIQVSLKGNKKGRKWESLVGYKLSDLIKHLKKTMPEGYDWKDYLEGRLHIDHEIPISAYNFDKPEDLQFRECWSLSNLRLLPARENLMKSDKITKSFQTLLKI